MQGKARKLPAELQREHRWRSQPDAFAEVWDELRAKLAVNARLQVKTLFDDLQRRYPCPFADGQIRTPQRRVKQWRATEGPPKDVFFEQVYTVSVGIHVQEDARRDDPGGAVPYVIYHFVLPQSN